MGAPTRKLADLFYELRTRTEGLDKDLKSAERSFGRLTDFVLKHPTVAVAAVGTAMLGVAVKAKAMADAVERPLTRLGAILPTTTEGFEQLRGAIERLSESTGIAQSELAGLAQEAGRTGAESAAAVQQRVEAAVTAAQASGEDARQILDGLDQVLDTFRLHSEQSAAALAQLFAIARGRMPLTELLQGISHAAPALNRLGIDFDTATRALAALLEKGLRAHAVQQELNKLANEGQAGRRAIEDLAASVPAATDALTQLQAAADRVNNAAGNAGERLQRRFDAVMIRLGEHVRTLVLPELEGLLGIFDRLDRAETARVQQGTRAILEFADAAAKVTNFRLLPGGGAFALPKALVDVGQAAAEGRAGLEALGDRTLEVLQGKLETLARSPALAGPNEGLKARLDQITAAVKSARAALAGPLPLPGGGTGTGTTGGLPSDRLAAERGAAEAAAKIREEELAKINKALDELREKGLQARHDLRLMDVQSMQDLAQAAGATVAFLDSQIDEITRKIRAQGRAALLPEPDIEAAVSRATVALRAAREAALALNGALARLDVPPDVAQRLTSPLEKAAADLDKLRQKLIDQGIGGAELSRALGEAAVEKFSAALRENGLAAADANRIATELAKTWGTVGSAASDLATNIATIGSAILSVASAVGQLDANTEHLARGILNLGTGIANVVAGNKLQGGLQILGGVSDLVGSILSGDREAKAQRERLHREALAALDAIKKNTGDLLRSSLTGSQFDRLRATLQRVTNPTGADMGKNGSNIDRFVQDQIAAAGFSWEQLQAIAKEFGITLDFTVQSFRDFLNALDAVDFTGFVDTLTGRMEILGKTLQVQGITDPLARFTAQVHEFAGTVEDGVPIIVSALGGLDLTTVEGRAELLTRFQAIWQQALDGTLTAADLGGATMSEFVEQLFNIILELQGLQPQVRSATEQLQKTFDELGIAVSLGAQDARGEFESAIAALFQAFPDLIGQLDISSLDALKASIAAVVASFGDPGTWTDEQKAIASAFQAVIQLFGAIEDEAAAARNAILQGARTKIDVEGITDPLQQLGIDVAAFIQAFGELDPALADFFAQFDLATQEGLDGFLAALAPFIEGLQDGSIVIEGLTGQALADFIGGLVDIDHAARSAANSIQTFADLVSQAFSEIDLEAQIFGTSAVDAINQKAQALGVGAFDLNTQAGRDALLASLRTLAGTTTDKPTLRLIADLVRELGSLPDLPGAVGDAVQQAVAGETASIASGARQLTEVTGLRMADYLATEVLLSRQQLAALEMLVGSRVAPTALLRPPALPSSITNNVSGDVVVTIGSITMSILAQTSDPNALAGQLGDAFVARLTREISRRLAEEMATQRRLSGTVGVS